MKGSAGVNGSRCVAGNGGRPDGYAAGVEDSGDEGGRGSGWVGSKKTQREGAVWRGPGLVWVGGVERRAWCYSGR